ncbi:hypothetical protein QBC42DRAFT_61437 [Cladorrhinum samala]|uniref:C2H2-type domain-containing protein n=1 Tax=Cladorrhinum samala TaxID=585594 RepID=A0AAV9HA15_9PEZI|nr:hypothetical protein QBC42DRAFT_61437 [Cladorrhinum samala]
MAIPVDDALQPNINLDPNNIHQFLSSFRQTARGGHGQAYFNTSRSAGSVSSDLSELDNFHYPQTKTSAGYTASSRAPSVASTMPSSHAASVFSRNSRGNKSIASSAPSRGPRRQPAEQFFNRTAPQPDSRPGHNYTLWCEFGDLVGCRATFRLDQETAWVDHHLEHLQDHCPTQLVCWFCDGGQFTANDAAGAYATFRERMEHIRQHIMQEPMLAVGNMRPDFNLVQHIRQSGLLPESMYQHAIKYDELPDQYRLPVSSSSSRPPHRPSRSREQGEFYVAGGQAERRRERREKGR